MLERLINANGISGKEIEVRDVIQKEIKEYVDEVHVDKVGNLVAHKKGNKPTVMLAAHMDEVGLIVSRIHDDSSGKEEDGRIHFLTIGGIDPAVLLGQRVSIDDKIIGVITTSDVSEGKEVSELPKLEELYVDTGLTKKELLKKGIDVGSYVSFAQCNYCTLGSSKVISGKAIDDRAGCHVLIELAKRLKKVKNDIYYVFTVQEEIGLYGAKISAYKIEPDWAVVVDVVDADNKSRKIGEGPCITIMDSDMLGNPCINNWLKDIARKHKIPLQYDVSDLGTTDALSISISKEGIPTAVVGFPVKSLHTASSMAHTDDMDNAIKLLEKLLRNPPKVCIV